ncbi:MAG: hypothetical protein LBG69_05145 [Zoogloeaceae bacterium]|jgi:hypothetical protein|nr:hypothetical protein [Zoogloeaceae bacterium]
MPILIDVEPLPACCTDHALETLSKALAGEDGNSRDVWERHESPYISGLIEGFTVLGISASEAAQKALLELLKNAAGKTVPAHSAASSARSRGVLPENLSGRYTAKEIDLLARRLRSIPASSLTLAEWGEVTNLLLARHVPMESLLERVREFSAKAFLMGRLEGLLSSEGAPVLAENALLDVAEKMPGTVSAARSAFRMSDSAHSVLEYCRLRNCSYPGFLRFCGKLFRMAHFCRSHSRFAAPQSPPILEGEQKTTPGEMFFLTEKNPYGQKNNPFRLSCFLHSLQKNPRLRARAATLREGGLAGMSAKPLQTRNMLDFPSTTNQGMGVMSTLALTFFEALQAANVPQDKAKAAAESLDREFEQRYAAQKQEFEQQCAIQARESVSRAEMEKMRGELATKADLYAIKTEIKADIEKVRGELRSEISSTKVELLKWFIGVAIAQFSGIAYLLVRLTGKA